MKSNPNLVGYESQFTDLKRLIESTLLKGESNSVLLLGPRGVGKSRLVSLVLDSVRDFCDDGDGDDRDRCLKGEEIVVRLHGLLQNDEKLALKEITKQLKLETVVGEKVFESFTEHLDFLLSSLKSGGRQQSRPIVFILEEFDLFCAHINQTLLYNLFDVTQSQATPLCVVGISAQLDVIERLEKRVRSRFSHRQIYMNLKNFDAYSELARRILIDERKILEGIVSFFLSSKSVRKYLEVVFLLRQDPSFLKQVLYLALMLDEDRGLSEDGLRRALDHLDVKFDKFMIENLTLLELALLISAKHMRVIYENQPFNFEMVYHELQKFVTRKSFTILKYDRPVVLKAFETLIVDELITLVDDRRLKSQKEYRLYNLQILNEQLISVIQENKSIPLDLKEWAVSELH